jgi:hypothetical protein
LPSGLTRSANAKVRRRPNPRRAKIHRSYTVQEIAKLYGVHKNTVREWIRAGLATIDDRRPQLVLGSVLLAFVQARRLKNKRPCKPGEIYCVRCRAPKNPAGDFADYKPTSSTSGQMIGICPTCECLMYRAVSLAKLAQVCGKLAVTIAKEQPRLDESREPSVNSDFRPGTTDHEISQRHQRTY